MKLVARIWIGISVAILYYIVAGLIGISASPADKKAAEAIFAVGIVFALLIVFAWQDRRAKIAAAAMHVLLLGYCTVIAT